MAAACTPPTTPGGGGNLAPTASVTATPDSGTAPLEVEFSSAGSVDPDGTILSYEWDFGDGSPVESGSDATHTYTSDGTFTASLTVTDDDGASGTATASIVVAGVNASPTAVISADPTTGKAPLAVAFDGTGSTDADGTIAGYAWDFGGGATSTDPTPSHVFTVAGPHVVSLTVTDDDGATATETTTITVVPNVAPVAAASATPTSGKSPLDVAFSSAGSTDPDGAIASYSWAFGDGGTSTAADPNHVYAAAGSYVATLTVTDDSGSTDSTTVSVEVAANVAPTAVANSNVTAGQAPLAVHFNSAGSSDPDGGIVSTSWTFGDGNGSSAANPTYTYGTPGTYTATLTVADAEGATSSATISIEVDEIPNEAPTAVAAATPTTQRVGLPVVFSSAGSADTDGTIASYHWDFGDGQSANTANPTHAYALPGVRTATLTVTDNAGGTATASVEITVTPNAAPTAAASGTPTTGTEPLLVTFSSAGSNDTDGTIVSYAWDFGDGGSSSSANPSRTYTAPGTYTAQLTVTDDFGATDTATVTVVVIANQVPTAAINASPQSGPRPLAVAFDGTASSDPEGATLTYAWDFGDGGNGTGATPSHTYAVGSYTATLVVTDAGGKVSAPVTIAITVYIDDDGDGSTAANDCNDADATIYPGAPDALDSTAKDTNCDGVDGILADTVFVQAPGGADSGSCGSTASPCATIGQGVTNAVAGGRTVVQVVSGTYAAFNLNSTAGVTVRGGYAAGFTSRSGTTTVNGTVGISSSTNATLLDLTINGTSGGASTGVLVTGGSAALTRLTVDSGTPSGAGNSAYGVRAISGATVSVTDSTITAKPGVAGVTNGGSPGAAAQGCTGSNGAGASGASSPGNGASSCGGSGAARSGAGGRGGSYSGGGSNGEAGGGGAGG
ncbi:MAG: PKD domain-containing protein, partial [Actinomycetota bacterium]|nr:PKD domain-containing protein [Actinomycetota bacterium]